MKVFVNRKPVNGPWGGGNKTVRRLSERLVLLGHEVGFELDRPDYEVLVCFDPRPNHAGVDYRHMAEYKRMFNAKLIQRVGDLGTHGKPELFDLVKRSIMNADKVIFPSQWALDRSGCKGDSIVIPNMPDQIFQARKRLREKPEGTVRIATHHWSNNPKKGFEIYKFMDVNAHRDISFSYMGRVPDGFVFKNSSYYKPGNDQEVADFLCDADVYMTASKEEAGANHVLEAMAIGLPVLYHTDGGSIPEYVLNRGIPFTNKNEIFDSIDHLLAKFDELSAACQNYDDTIETQIDEYCKIICKI